MKIKKGASNHQNTFFWYKNHIYLFNNNFIRNACLNTFHRWNTFNNFNHFHHFINSKNNYYEKIQYQDCDKYQYNKLNYFVNPKTEYTKINRNNNGVPVDINLYRLVGSVILMLFTWPFIIYSMIQDRRST